MTAPFRALDGAFFDLSTRAKIRVAGGDRIRFLNGQVTNNVRKATSSSAVAACVLNAKGKMDAHIFVSANTDFFLIDADPKLRESLLARLERYVIADDVQIEDVTPQLSILHVLATTPPALPGDCKMVSSSRFGEPGFDIWIDAARHDEVFQHLSAALPFCGDDCAEVFRIEQAVPAWDRELTEQIIPVEANLEESCIDYEKGCYIGQEIISRMKMSGQRNKKLCGLVSLHDAPLVAGMKLFPKGTKGKEVGWITSASHSERLEKEIALAYIKRGFDLAGTNFDAVEPTNPSGSPVAGVAIVDLPFTEKCIGID